MSERPTPETDTLDRELHNPKVLSDRYSIMRDHSNNLERQRNNLQDQRDFAMGEIERLRTEYFEMLDSAWGLIANAGGGNCSWDLQTEQWRQAARRWRDKYLSTTASKEEKEAAK